MDWKGFEREKVNFGDPPPNERIAKRQKIRWSAQDWVHAALADLAPWLLAGSTAPENAAEIIKEILNKIEVESNPEIRRLRRNFLIKGIDAGCRQGIWSLKVPPQTLRAPLPKPTITEKNFSELAKAKHLRGIVFSSLADPDFPDMKRLLAMRKFGHARVKLTQQDVNVGRVLLAAILFGGITSKNNLEVIAQANPNTLFYFKGKLGMEWPTYSEIDGKIERWYRWYPEQISGSLLAKIHREGSFPMVLPTSNLSVSNAIWFRIEAALALITVEKEERPRSLTQLIDWAATWLNFHIPPFLAAYACGKVSAVSVAPEVHLRILTGRPVAVMNVVKEDNDSPHPRRPIDVMADARKANANFNVLRADLRNVIKAASEKHKALRAINKYLARSDLSPAFVRLAEWMHNLCDHHRDGGVRRRLSTIYEYLSRIDTPLAVALESRDPAALDAEELEALYTEVLDGLGVRRAARAVPALMLFHRYLVDAHGVPNDVGEVFSGRTVDGRVDAGLITEAEYIQALKLLKSGVLGQSAWVAQMQTIALMLGFRAEMRRGEVRRLRIGDVCGAVFGVLYVRTTDQGQVKSISGIRNLSLAGHFPDEEMTLLRNFVMKRLRDITGDDNISRLLSPYEDSCDLRTRPLFEHPNQPGQLFSDKSLFDPIVAVLVTVTGDPSAHFHQLRTGGQNRILLCVMEEELPGCSLHWDDTGAIARESAKLNRELLGTQGPDRRKLWAVSTDAGHASPATTTGSYIHTLDWLLGYALQGVSPKITGEILFSMTGLNQNNIRVLRSQNEVDPSDYAYWIAHKNKAWRSSVTPKFTESCGPSEVTIAQTYTTACKPPLQGMDVIVANHEVIQKKFDFATVARRNGILPEQLEVWVAEAKALDGLVGLSPLRRKRHAAISVKHEAHGLSIERQIAVFPPILQFDERERLNIWSVALHEFALRDPTAAADWLNVFWRHRDAHAVSFRSLDIAKDYHATLIRIAAPLGASIIYKLYPLKGNALDETSQAEKWATMLGIAVENIKFGNTKAHQYDGDKIGVLEIAIGHQHHLSRQTLKLRKAGIKPMVNWEKNKSSALAGASYVVTLWMLSGLYSVKDGSESIPIKKPPQ